ncbi:unnamed protein product [marine sediment metagenome]|uniref:Uncharacterized protein n=1 Tax=marine sediment metagenome TaxID=412755 RepID=X0YM24_9ZZZZ
MKKKLILILLFSIIALSVAFFAYYIYTDQIKNRQPSRQVFNPEEINIDISRTITKIDFKNPAMLERVKITVIIGSTYKANSWIKISSFNTRILVLTLSTADSY